MLEKLIKLVKTQRRLKRVCIFFFAFAASLTVMGSNYDIFYGSGGQMPPEKAHTASSSGVAESQEVGMNRTLVSSAQTERGFADGLMLAVTATQLEEIITAAVEEKKDSPEIESKIEDEEDANDTESSNFVYSDRIPMSLELQEYTYAKCEERGLEYELILAIIWRESRFSADAVNINSNGTRDNGIMQINDVNRKWLKDNYGITDLMDPYQNIDAGTAMLGRLTDKYGSNNAMMAYQYGEGGMARRLKQGITTSSAIEQAYKQRDHYRKII